MPSVCFYFQVHQPYRVRPYGIFDIGSKHDYFNAEMNREICRKVAANCYLPANALMLELLRKHPEFKVSYSISGITLEQFAEYAPEVLTSFKRLYATGRVEFLAETYYHSLSSLFDQKEFKAQVAAHAKALKDLLGVKKPRVFRNTELIYSDAIADAVKGMGFAGMLAEGTEKILGRRSPNFVYHAGKARNFKLLLKNFKLSDDIAFRFSNKGWDQYPLDAAKFARWLRALKGDTVNLFMDYETIGEHQWKDSGIFAFFKELPAAVLKDPKASFLTPSETLAAYPSAGAVSAPEPVSWADAERDLSAWLGNPMQDATAAWIYRLGRQVTASKDRALLDTWRKLQTSDHFYYMCTKFWSDGDVHKYFSIYDSPQDSYMIMNNVLTDFELRLKKFKPAKA